MIFDTYPYVKLARPDAFRDSQGIDNSTKDVEKSHEGQPAQGRILYGFLETISYDVMQGGYDTTQAKTYEHSCKARKEATLSYLWHFFSVPRLGLGH